MKLTQLTALTLTMNTNETTEVVDTSNAFHRCLPAETNTMMQN